MAFVALGTLHFADRDRVSPEVRFFYWGSPTTSTGRAAVAVLEVAIGFGLLFTA